MDMKHEHYSLNRDRSLQAVQVGFFRPLLNIKELLLPDFLDKERPMARGKRASVLYQREAMITYVIRNDSLNCN